MPVVVLIGRELSSVEWSFLKQRTSALLTKGTFAADEPRARVQQSLGDRTPG